MLRHQTVADGGYALVRDVVQFLDTASPSEDFEARETMLRYIGDDRSDIWSVALEAAIQKWGGSIAPSIHELILQRDRGKEWTDYVLFALLRSRYLPIAPLALRRLESRLDGEDDSVFPHLCALGYADPHTSISLTAQFLLRATAKGDMLLVEGCVSPLVGHFMDIDPAMIMSVLEQVADSNAVLANTFGASIRAYLCKEFIVRRYGEERCQTLSRLLSLYEVR